MNLSDCTLSQLLYLSRYTEHRHDALLELDKRMGRK